MTHIHQINETHLDNGDIMKTICGRMLVEDTITDETLTCMLKFGIKCGFSQCWIKALQAL